MLTRTRWGLYTISTGGNQLGAREAGINVGRIKYGNFMITGVLGALVGLQSAFYNNTIDPLAGGYQPMFYAVTAAVIGGTAMLGGVGTIIGAFLGAIAPGHPDRRLQRPGDQRERDSDRLRHRDPPRHGRERSASQGAAKEGGSDDVTAAAAGAGGVAPADGQAPDGDVLRAEHISKRFGAVTALVDVNLHLARGEVLGLLGDNGAGKSTLIKIFCGFQPPDSGRLVVNGQEVALKSVDHARSLGIDAVYQDLALINQLTVFHNMFLKRERIRVAAAEQPGRCATKARQLSRRDGRQHPVGGRPGRQPVRRAAAGDRGGPRPSTRTRRSCCSTSRSPRWARRRRRSSWTWSAT